MKLSTAYHPQTDGQMERINQELEQYLRVFIDHRQEQWPDWLGTAEFAYNNKIHTVTKILPFKANYGPKEMKKFAKKRQKEKEEYRVGDLVLLSTKDLKWQMKGRRSEKLTKHFVGPYKVKGIVSSNAIELELPKSIRIHPMVNVSRVQLYKPQVEGQKKIPPKPVIIEGEEEFKIEKIINKRTVRGKEKFLVR